MKLKTKAEQLATLRAKEAEIKEQFDSILKPLQEEKEKVQAELINELKEVGLTSIKVESGESYTLKVGKSLRIASEALAFGWAIENRAVSVNKILVKQKLKDVENIPKGFIFEEREYIAISKPKIKN